MSASAPTAESSVAPEIRRVRRIVTGLDARGASVIISDRVASHVTPFMGIANFAVTDFWKALTRADNGDATADDRCDGPFEVLPPAGGSVFRITQFPPEKDWSRPVEPSAGARSESQQMNIAPHARHPHMHRTPTLDYVIILSGEIWVVMDEGESKLSAGDVLIQRGTHHAWSNRSDGPCIVAFVMLDART